MTSRLWPRVSCWFGILLLVVGGLGMLDAFLSPATIVEQSGDLPVTIHVVSPSPWIAFALWSLTALVGFVLNRLGARSLEILRVGAAEAAVR